jgi:hypothetical protein
VRRGGGWLMTLSHQGVRDRNAKQVPWGKAFRKPVCLWVRRLTTAARNMLLKMAKIAAGHWWLTCNPSYSVGRDQEDRRSRPAQANSSWDSISKITTARKKQANKQTK